MAGLVVHFGAGALGRGLVVPLLEGSGRDVVIVDVDERLVRRIRQDGGYPLDVIDESSGGVTHEIRVRDAICSLTDQAALAGYLREADIITTSVRRENLCHVASTLLGSLDGSSRKTVICAENVEHVGSFFRKELEVASSTPRDADVCASLTVPDTVVDRICAASWPDNPTVKTERYHELAVDAAVVPDTGLPLVSSVDDIAAAFARKRLLMNTFADASSFLARANGLTYLHEAVCNEEVQGELAPYFSCFDVLLSTKYGFSTDELEKWKELYRTRLANPGIQRDLSTVARGLWAKLSMRERFVWPLAELLDAGYDVHESTQILVRLIQKASGEADSEIRRHLQESWGADERGRRLLDLAEEALG